MESCENNLSNKGSFVNISCPTENKQVLPQKYQKQIYLELIVCFQVSFIHPVLFNIYFLFKEFSSLSNCHGGYLILLPWWGSLDTLVTRLSSNRCRTMKTQISRQEVNLDGNFEIIFLSLHINICCDPSLGLPWQSSSNERNTCFF